MSEWHIAKTTHEDGVELDRSISWCGVECVGWYFEDTHHAALCVDGVQGMCVECVSIIIEEFSSRIEKE